MKRCPECGRNYNDDSMSFCLDDGAELLFGPASIDEPATAILSEPPALAGGQFNESATRPQIHATAAEAEPQEQLKDSSKKQSFSAHRAAKPFVVLVVGILILVGGFFGYRYFKTAGTEQINSIAVLPFENRSGSVDTDYLSDGLADSLIYRLSQLPNLKVSPTSSVMRYKGSATDVAQIAKELDVDAVMSGRLTQRGDDLSISVQLIDSRTKKLIWAEQYDRKMADLLATQREIATAITQKLQLKLAGDERGITKKYTSSSEAYQLYLKGRYYFARRTKDDFAKAIDSYQQAIKLDQNFALAYARLAETYNQLPAYPYQSPAEAFPQAKAAATRALEIDPALSEGHTALANTLAAYDWDWPAAEREFKRAIELDPNSAAAHFRYGQLYLGAQGRVSDAITEMNIGVDLEPLDVNMGATTAWFSSWTGQNEKVFDAAKKSYDLDPNHPVGRNILTQIYIYRGMYAEALATIEAAQKIDQNSQWDLQTLGVTYARMGRQNEAKQIISNLQQIARTQYVMSYYIAAIYVALDDREKAFAELEKAFQAHDWRLMLIKVDPFMTPLRGDPRYKDLLKRMGLPY